MIDAIDILNLHFSYCILHTVLRSIINVTTFQRFDCFTLMILGRVRYCLHVPWPPPIAVTPLFSMIIWSKLPAKTPAPAVRESPIAAITSISPGLNLCTDFGTSGDRPPKIYCQSCNTTQVHKSVSYLYYLFNDNLVNCTTSNSILQ